MEHRRVVHPAGEDSDLRGAIHRQAQRLLIGRVAGHPFDVSSARGPAEDFGITVDHDHMSATSQAFRYRASDPASAACHHIGRCHSQDATRRKVAASERLPHLLGDDVIPGGVVQGDGSVVASEDVQLQGARAVLPGRLLDRTEERAAESGSPPGLDDLDVVVAMEQQPQTFADRLMIFRQQHSQSLHRPAFSTSYVCCILPRVEQGHQVSTLDYRLVQI